MEFLESLAIAAPDLRQTYADMEDLFNKKLWHQLSTILDVFLTENSNLRGDNFRQFENKLDPIRFVQIVSRIGFNFDNLQNALDFFLSFMNPKSKLGSEATLCLEMDAMVCKLKLGNLEEVKLALENTLVKLNAGSFKEPMVFSKYYKASADYRKVVGTPQDFYQSALMYLTYTSMDELTDKEKYELATDLALAAICGNSVFNLGEVIATPVLKYLGGTPNSWLRDIIVALYKGDVNSFNEVVESNKNKYFSHLALSSNHEYIKRKAVLLSVLNLAFDRDPHDRTISFNEIASKSCIDCDQVEWVLMKALSIGIIKGRMNEIDQTISVTWVQPRVLDPLQITKVATQVKNWSDRVHLALTSIKDQTPELYF